MGAPFSDITLYTPTPYIAGTQEYWEDTSLKNYVSDLYVQKMFGYKPPKTSRITIQPAFHKIWNRTWKNGSIVAIAPFYSHDEYSKLDKMGRYKYILDLIQNATLSLSDEYGWNRTIFEKAYQEVLGSNFIFSMNFPTKKSRDKLKLANLSIEKTETITTVFANIETVNLKYKIKLFEKQNIWWYDCAYMLVRFSKWHDSDRFGFDYAKGKISGWYSIKNNNVALLENGHEVTEIDFKKYFLLG
jgi:hypothetical protein